MSAFQKGINDGFLYGDFQFAIDEKAENFLTEGVFSCYRRVDDGDSGLKPASTQKQAELAPSDWLRLLLLAHANKSEAYARYRDYYLSTNGQTYWSDEHQLGYYPDGYHASI